MTFEEFYGESYTVIKKGEEALLNLLTEFSETKKDKEGVKAIVYTCSRIKNPESMMKKLESRGLPKTAETALSDVYDSIGVRAVCAFVEDAYRLVRWLKKQSLILIDEEKDYYAYPKPNGYRSYHMLVRIAEGEAKGCRAEIQVRTIAIDFWATLEHQIKYKKDMSDEKLIRSELKRCADEIASVDISMQTIRDIIRENNNGLNQ